MKVTAIKAQVKNAERVSIYIDGTYAFSLNHTQLLEQKLHVGLEFDASRVDELKRVSDFGKLYDRILRYALLRPRSQREVEEYCRRKQFDPGACQVILQKLAARQYVNDEHFATAWVENRRLNKAVSERRLRLELRQKGITDDIISRVIAEGAYDPHAALQALITKKQRLQRYRDDDQKLLQYLVRQGFPYDDVKQALNDSTLDS